MYAHGEEESAYPLAFLLWRCSLKYGLSIHFIPFTKDYTSGYHQPLVPLFLAKHFNKPTLHSDITLTFDELGDLFSSGLYVLRHCLHCTLLISFSESVQNRSVLSHRLFCPSGYHPQQIGSKSGPQPPNYILQHL